jgi:flagellar hook assembly protein FlgD
MHRRLPAVIVAAVMSAALLVPLVAVAGIAPATRAASPVKVVVVVGPTHTLTDSNLQWAAAIAQRAASHGAQVVTVFHPHATWAEVSAAAVGANVLIYLGHGNGFPSPYTTTLMRDRQDGMGLDPVDGAQDDQVQYYGEQYMATLRLAPGSLVILNHLCYASGNSEPGQPQPTETVAVERVDNFAAGFLAGGASAVMALGTQDAGDIVDGLFGPPQTLDQLFMADGGIGTASLTVASERTPGAQLHLDPQTATSNFYRSLSGKLALLTSDVVGGDAGAAVAPGVQPAPTNPPDPSSTSSSLVPAPAPVLVSFAGASVFTPNGDGITDTLGLTYDLSAPATLDVSVLTVAGASVRHFTVAAARGTGRFTWDGRDDSGASVPDGTYLLRATPVGTGGEAGTTMTIVTRVMTAISAPAATPAVFYPLDRDGVADATSLSMTLTQPASVTWTVEDAAGKTVRVLWDHQQTPAGPWRESWNGTGRRAGSSALVPLPAGRYQSVISATTAAGTLLMRTPVWLMPFRLTPSRTTAAAGQVVTVSIVAAEALRGAPRLLVSQPGMAAYSVTAISMPGSPLAFRAVFRVRAGNSGTITLRVVGTERTGRSVATGTTLTLR